MKKQKNKQKQSEPINIGPGIFTQNFGRWDFVHSNRTPQEQATLMKIVNEFRQNFPKQMEGKVAELEALLAKHNSFDLLANLTTLRLFVNPETYDEPTHDHGDAAVEYATLLCLKSSFCSACEPFVGNACEDIIQRLDEIIGTTLYYYGLEGAGDAGPDTELDDLHNETIRSELIVRNPGYPHHLTEILISLFEPFETWLLETAGFTIKDLLSIEKAIYALINTKFLSSREIIKAQENRFHTDFEEFIRTGRVLKETQQIYFDKLLQLPKEDRPRAITDLYALGFFSRLGRELSFTAQELSETSGVTIDRINSALLVFSLRFGSVGKEFLWPKPNHPLKLQPFIQHDDRFMCPNPKLFAWAIRPTIERLLNPVSKANVNATRETWTKYSDHRANVLEQESLRLLALALRHSKTYQNLKYEFKNGDRNENGELDGLVIFDKTLILVEAKSGNFPLKARGGFRDAIRENLKKLVAEAHEQALKAKNFLESQERSIFQLENAESLVLDRREFERIIMIVVTLEPLDVFCANLHQTAELGLFPSGDLPWVISLLELRVIAETIEFPSQLVHYLQRRLHIHRIKKLEAHDDLDWFGCYLSDGLVFEAYERTHLDTIRLASFTTDFDDYYFYKQGSRETKAEMPRQKMPDLFRKIVLGIDGSRRKGHSEAVFMLLEFDENGKNQFSETLACYLEEVAQSGDIKNLNLKIPDKKFGVTCCVCPPHRVQEASYGFSSFAELMKYDAKADRWLAILCISGQSKTVGSWLLLNSIWRPDAVLETDLVNLGKKHSSVWQKVSARKL